MPGTRRTARLSGWRTGAVAVVIAALHAATAAAAEGDLTPLRQARTAALEIVESYEALRSLDDRRRPVEVPQPLPNVALPFRSVVDGLLRHAGVELLRDPAAAAGLRIAIDCRGATNGQLYDAAIQSRRIRELRYTDAAIVGTLRLVAGDAVLERGFAGEIRPDVSIIGVVDGRDPRRDPNYAPFRAAFEAQGGFLDVLGGTVGEIWGKAPLEAALDDRDPLVREAARRALAMQP
jgi:hypothetical protein